jgi:EmrB/QacA subfamily drug resistance transporter
MMEKRIVLLIATIASFVTPFMASAVNIALPTIGKELSIPAIALGWVATAYIFAAAVFLIPFGKAADIYGRKRMFLAGISIYTIASACCIFAPSASPLIALRVLQGIGASMTFSTGVAIVTSIVPAAERGRVLGITTAAVYIGLSVGPVAGGVLTQHFGWRSIFLVTVPLGLAVIALVVGKLKGEWAEARGERFDLPGALISVLSLTAVMYGFSRLPSLTGAALLLAGVIGVVAFVRWELRAEHPLLHMELFAGNRVFAFSNLAALISYSASFAVTFLMSLYLQYIKALTPQSAGLILVAQPVVMAGLSPFAGRLSDRIDSRIVASSGMALTAAALFFLVFLGAGTSTPVLVLNLMLLGLGFALFSSPNTNAVMSSVEPRFYGVASATLATMRMIGQMLSMGIAMLVFAVRVGEVRITAEHHEAFLTSLRIAFIIFAILSVAGVFASLARGTDGRRRAEEALASPSKGAGHV